VGKNKFLTWAVILLLLANTATIVAFWMGRKNHGPELKGPPAEFLIKELGLDKTQQKQFLQLVAAHREAANGLREQIRESKDKFFNLLQQPGIADSTRANEAEAVSQLTKQLDLLTFEHFKQVRALCNTDQQRKFDNIIHDVLRSMGGPGPHPNGPPPGDHHGPPSPGE
jgi:protein CpxP